MKLPAGCAERYVVEREIASGGYGVLLQARHLELKRLVALKLLHREHVTDVEQVRRFVQEAQLTAALDHPAIVKVLDHGVDDGVPWIAYELLPGPSLRAVVQAGPLPWADAVAIVEQVAHALEAAHAAGVLHRDVKPDNVIAAGDGAYKLADFGIARLSSGSAIQTAAGLILGTPAYLSPEQCAGDAPTASSDIYALGAMLFELVSGEPPHGADDALRVIQRRLTGPAPALRDRVPRTPAALSALVANLLEREPAARPGSAREVADGLASLFGVPSGSGGARRGATAATRRGPRASTIPVTNPPAKRGAPPLAVGVAVLALAALAGAVFVRSARTVPSPAPTASAPPASGAGGPPHAAALRDHAGEVKEMLDAWDAAHPDGRHRAADDDDATLAWLTKHATELIDAFASTPEPVMTVEETAEIEVELARESARTRLQQAGRRVIEHLLLLTELHSGHVLGEAGQMSVAVAVRDLETLLDIDPAPNKRRQPPTLQHYFEPRATRDLVLDPTAPMDLFGRTVWMDLWLRSGGHAFDQAGTGFDRDRPIAALRAMLDGTKRKIPVHHQWYTWHVLDLTARMLSCFHYERPQTPTRADATTWSRRWSDASKLVEALWERAAACAELQAPPLTVVQKLHRALLEFRADAALLGGPHMRDDFDRALESVPGNSRGLNWYLLATRVRLELHRPDTAACIQDAIELIGEDPRVHTVALAAAALALQNELTDAAKNAPPSWRDFASERGASDVPADLPADPPDERGDFLRWCIALRYFCPDGKHNLFDQRPAVEGVGALLRFAGGKEWRRSSQQVRWYIAQCLGHTLNRFHEQVRENEDLELRRRQFDELLPLVPATIAAANVRALGALRLAEIRSEIVLFTRAVQKLHDPALDERLDRAIVETRELDRGLLWRLMMVERIERPGPGAIELCRAALSQLEALENESDQPVPAGSVRAGAPTKKGRVALWSMRAFVLKRYAFADPDLGVREREQFRQVLVLDRDGRIRLLAASLDR